MALAPDVSEALQRRAEEYARAILDDTEYVGVLTIELLDSESGLIANEITPRVHNSGHWTIEGARTSQFENHVRVVSGLPLGRTGLCEWENFPSMIALIAMSLKQERASMLVCQVPPASAENNSRNSATTPLALIEVLSTCPGFQDN